MEEIRRSTTLENPTVSLSQGSTEDKRKEYPRKENELICPISRDKDNLPAFDLGCRKRISISKFQGKIRIDIREYYETNTGMLPTKKGVSLSLEDYALLK